MKSLKPVSPVGFGCYRVSDEAPGHRRALEQALLMGCNLIDTSTNYMNGSSERLVGETLEALIAGGKLRREEVTVVTKAGYVQGDNLELARERVRQGSPFPEMVEFQDGCWHCISPEFLADQLTRSLSRLRMSKVDCLLLHNPEYFLKSGGSHSEYYRRIGEAFRHLEAEVDKGRIDSYGISSNTFPDSRESPEYTSLETALELAEGIRPGKHHFRVIQFPLNLLEPGAVLEPNNTGKTVAELAAARGLLTLVNRPLNAFSGDRMVRLADFPAPSGDDPASRLKTALAAAMELEASYPGKKHVQARQIAWAHVIRENFERLSEVSAWKEVYNYRIEPTLDAALAVLSQHADTAGWARRYETASGELFDAFGAYIESRAAAESERLKEVIDKTAPELHSSPSLSQKAIRVYRSLPGIGCILVGMRQASYVADVMRLEPPISAESAFDVLHAVAEQEAAHLEGGAG